MSKGKKLTLNQWGKIISLTLMAYDRNEQRDYGYYVDGGKLYITYPAEYCAIPREVTERDYWDLNDETGGDNGHPTFHEMAMGIVKVFSL